MKPDMTASAGGDDGAERWAIRLDARTLTSDEEAELSAWLAEDPRREGALLRAQAMLSYLDRGRALGGVNDRMKGPVDRRGFIAVAGGAVAAALVAGIYFALPKAQKITTQLGEVRQVPLSDGSVATVNTASKVVVQFGQKDRVIKLADGEAWFRVAPNKQKPFIVEAGDVRVRAVGTAFSVRRRGESADVLVTEGTVETWVVGKEADRVRLSAGSKAFVSTDEGKIDALAAPKEIDRALAWRTGELALDGETLEYAASEINRYNAKKIVIDDPELGREGLVGYFRTTEPANFGHAVAAMIGARVVEDGDTIHIAKNTM